MRRLSVLLLLLAPARRGLRLGAPPRSRGSDDALNDASTSRSRVEAGGQRSMPDWAVRWSTGLDRLCERPGELVSGQGHAAFGWHASALRGPRRLLGAKVGGKMYWVKASSDGTRSADRFLPGPSGMSPDRLLKDLIKASKKVDKVGSEEIRGVTTTHYRAHLDRSKLGSDANDDVPEAVDAWIDEQGLPRRVRVPYGDGNDALAAVVDLFDFGVPVDVKARRRARSSPRRSSRSFMEQECADAGKDLEHTNPLCLIFGTTLVSHSSDKQFSPTETVPTTEGK